MHTSGKIGSSWSSASAGKANVTNLTDLNFAWNQPFSICSWIKYTTSDILEIFGVENTAVGWYVGQTTGKLSIIISSVWPTNSYIESTTSTYNDGAWKFYCAVYDGNVDSRIYVNGAEVATTIDANTLSANPSYSGKTPQGTMSLPIRFYVSDVAANKATQSGVKASESFIKKTLEKFSSVAQKKEAVFIEKQGVNLRDFYSGKISVVVDPLFTPANTLGYASARYYSPSTKSSSFTKPVNYTLSRKENYYFNTSYLSDYTASYTPSSSASYTPDYTSRYTPSSSESYTPDYTSRYTPTYNPSYTMDYTSRYKPDYTSRYNPNYKPKYLPPYNPPKNPSRKQNESKNESKFVKQYNKAFSQEKPRTFKPTNISNVILPLKTDWLKAIGYSKGGKKAKIQTIKLLPNKRKGNKQVASLLGFDFEKLF